MHAAAPMWRNGRRNGLKIRWAVIGPCRFESGHRQFSIANVGLQIADSQTNKLPQGYEKLYQAANGTTRYS